MSKDMTKILYHTWVYIHILNTSLMTWFRNGFTISSPSLIIHLSISYQSYTVRIGIYSYLWNNSGSTGTDVPVTVSNYQYWIYSDYHLLVTAGILSVATGKIDVWASVKTTNVLIRFCLSLLQHMDDGPQRATSSERRLGIRRQVHHVHHSPLFPSGANPLRRLGIGGKGAELAVAHAVHHGTAFVPRVEYAYLAADSNSIELRLAPAGHQRLKGLSW